MNKKFSTLLAGLALTTTVASAAGFIPQAGQAVKKLDDAALKGMYQLKDQNGKILAMSGKDSLYLVDQVGIDSLGVAATLWCVQVTKPEGQGQLPIYDFVNKKHGKFLAVSANVVDTLNFKPTPVVSKPIVVGANFQGWGWARTYDTALEQSATMYTHFTSDSVVFLTNTGNNVTIQKAAASSAPGFTTSGSATPLKLTLQTAAEVILKESEINAYLKDNKNLLTFAPNYQGDLKNPFTTVAFRVDSVNKYQSSLPVADYDYMLIKPVATTDSSYLRVDTASNDTGVRFNKFAWTKPSANADYKGYAVDSILSTNSKLADQHKFMFIYRPSVDSLFIRVQEARFMPDNNNTIPNWSNDALLEVRNEATSTGWDKDSLWIKLQNFPGTDTKIVTVGKLPINTKISFSVTSCVAAGNDNKSIEDGVYYVRNNKGQYLTSPIYKNGKEMQWVDVDDEIQNVAHMPAFQWIVLKDWTSADLKEKSPISIYNREFADANNMANASVKNIQLSQTTGATKYSANVSALFGLAVDSLTFDPVPEESVKDSLLGYKNIPASDMMVYKYKFNYLHGYNADKFVAKNAKDSVLNAKTEAGALFSILDGKIADYGYKVSDAVVKRIKGLKQLCRTEYRVALGADTLVTAKNEFMSVGQANYNDSYYKSKVDSFFFKENNHFANKDFYAFVRAYADSIDTYKVGVADDGLQLKYQPLNETRTSAFAVERDETPLYRRFNNVALNESATDGADSLRFVETVRKEYLMDENNRKGGLMDEAVDYLGIWTKDKATGLAFHVDTAWVTRGLGYIKPQYLISVDRTIVGTTDGYICEETGKHVTPDGKLTDDPKECVHSKLGKNGFVHAKFLVSFQDSVELSKTGRDKPYADIKGGYTRVGFVKAIQTADQLYFLVNGFEKMAPDNLDLVQITKAYKDANIFDTYVKSLKGDEHKNYTWSFRYVHPESAANVTEEGADNSFLIESNNYDGVSIAPDTAAWIKMQNGCIVLTDKSSTFGNAKTGGDGALVFNVENKENDELATDNETVTTSEVSVIAGNGAVRIANAEGKKVVISNILGQIIANTVITSSDATIAAPQGVVVVAVEGEEAVKAIVK